MSKFTEEPYVWSENEWMDWPWEEFNVKPELLRIIDFIVDERPDLNTREDAFREAMFMKTQQEHPDRYSAS